MNEYLYSTECIRDYTFEWSSGANSWLGKHDEFLFPFMAYCGYIMDFLIFSLVLFWYFKVNTSRFIAAMMMFYSSRVMI